MSKANDAATERYAELKGIERAHRGRDGWWVGLTPEMRTRKAPHCVPIPDWGGDLRAAAAELASISAPECDGGGEMPMAYRVEMVRRRTRDGFDLRAEATIGMEEMLRVYARGSASMVRDGCEDAGRLCALAVTRAMIRMREGEVTAYSSA